MASQGTVAAWLNIPPAAAIRAGHATSGIVRIDVTQEQIASLSKEEREVLAESKNVGLAEQPSPFGTLDATDALPEASFEGLRAALQAVVARRRTEREQEAAELAKAIARTEAWLSKAEREPPVEQPYEGGTWRPAHPDSDLWAIRSFFPRLPKTLNDRIQALTQRESDEAGRRNAAKFDAEARAWLASTKLEDLLNQVVKKGKLVWAAHSTFAGLPEYMRPLYSAAEAEAGRRNKDLAEARVVALRAAIGDWGTDIQKQKQAEGMLAEEEALRVVRDHVFAALDTCPRYERLTDADIEHETDIECDAGSKYSAEIASALDDAEYIALRKIKAAAPKEANVEARVHQAWCERCDGCVTERYAALVTLTWHGWQLSREYALS